MKELVELKIKKISLVSSPANKKSWLLKKSENVVEITAALRDFFSPDAFDPDEISKATSKEELLEALRMLKPFKENFPDDLEDGINLLVKCAASSFLSRPKVEKEEESGPEDDFPSILAPGEGLAIAIKKEVDEDELSEEEDEFLDPLERQLHEINLRLDKMEGGGIDEDPWPSIPLISSRIKKIEPVPEPVSKKEDGPTKTSIDGQVGGLFVIEKETDEDPWPSIFDASIFKTN
ncbi:hypothetical protein ES705_13245 [subsurface metagenome]